jgi:hypothetical protein
MEIHAGPPSNGKNARRRNIFIKDKVYMRR